MEEILVTIKLEKLVDKDAEKGKKLSENVPKIYTAFSKDLQFYIDELQ